MMENKELFLSIIIPIYNGADHLASTLESVLNSGIDAFSSEVLLVNDGSTDETLSICKRYLVEYPQLFRLFSKKTVVFLVRVIMACQRLGDSTFFF